MLRGYAAGLLIIVIGITLLARLSAAPYSSPDTVISIDGSGYDWGYDYCISLSGAKDQYQSVNYYLDSRDLIAFYFAYNTDWAFFRVDLLDLSYGAEAYTGGQDGLNIYVLIGWDGAPGYQQWVPDYILYQGKGIKLVDYHWVLAIAIYDSSSYRVYDYNWNKVVENSGLQVAFNSQWDFVELAVPRSILSNYGWSPDKQTWFRVVTSAGTSSGHLLADGMPRTEISVSDYAYWQGALFSTQKCPTVKLAIVHHGNQHIADNRALNNPLSRNSYGFVLWVHEDVSRLANRRIPVDIHISGTLLASYVWWDPGFVSYIRDLVNKGIVNIIGGVWSEYIPAYFYSNFNEPSLRFAKDYYRYIFGVDPLVAWVPERTWEDERTNMSAVFSLYYRAILLDEIEHHHNWMPNTNALKPHKYDTSKTEGRTLYVFFIHFETQQKLLSLHDGGLNYDLRLFYLSRALDPDQQQIIVYADDWEKAAGVAGWPVDPTQYELAIRWIAQHPWIQVVSLNDVVYWLDNGYWTPVQGYYCGYDTYKFIKQWVQGYPYDYRRAYDGWYWGTPYEKSFAWYGSGQTSPNYALPDTIMPFGDVFGYTSFNGSPNNTVIYRLFAPGNLMDMAPKNELWWLALVTANAMLYETAWHDEGDWDGDGLHDCPGWGLNIWNHIRHVNVLLEAAKWLDNVRKGLVSGINYRYDDFDWDGRKEVIVFSGKFFMWIDEKGGAIPFLVYYDAVSDMPQVVVGAPYGYWTRWDDAWYNSNHLALFVDDYFTATGKNYYDKVYVIEKIQANASNSIIIEFSSPDLDNSGAPDLRKIVYVVEQGEQVFISAEYSTERPGKLYVALGVSVNAWRSLFDGDSYIIVGQHEGSSSLTFIDPTTNIGITLTPARNAAWTNPGDLQKHNMEYHAKAVLDVSAGAISSVNALVGPGTANATVTPTTATNTSQDIHTETSTGTTANVTTTTAYTEIAPTLPNTTAMGTGPVITHTLTVTTTYLVVSEAITTYIITATRTVTLTLTETVAEERIYVVTDTVERTITLTRTQVVTETLTTTRKERVVGDYAIYVQSTLIGALMGGALVYMYVALKKR